MTAVGDLFAALGAIPRLAGAACRGRHELFDMRAIDDPTRPDAEEAAILICSTCPARRPCADWVDSSPPSRRPTGVVAGKVVRRPAPRTHGPAKTAAVA